LRGKAPVHDDLSVALTKLPPMPFKLIFEDLLQTWSAMLRVKRIAGSLIAGTRLQRAHLDLHLGMDGLSEKADKVIAALSRTPLNRRDPIPEFMYPETLVKRKLKEKTVL